MTSEPSENPGKLPDLDLRRRVAEACLWTGITPHANPDDPELFGFPPPSRSGKQFGPRPIPAYELDIAAAWGLVEMMAEANAAPIVCQNPHTRLWSFRTVYDPVVDSHGDSAPRAICLAYLAWRASQ